MNGGGGDEEGPWVRNGGQDCLGERPQGPGPRAQDVGRREGSQAAQGRGGLARLDGSF